MPSFQSGFEKRERVKAAINGDSVDRPPVSFWHHCHCKGSASLLAQFTVDFFVTRFDLDIIKIMPDIRYPLPRQSVSTLEDWRLVERWTAESEFTAAYVSAIRQIRAVVGHEYPLVVTLHSPLTMAQLLAPRPDATALWSSETLLQHLETAPDLVHGALANLASNLRQHAAACIAAGADGIYLSMIGCDETVAPSIYREVGRPYDLMVFQGAGNGWLNIAHIHGEHQLRTEEAYGYPISALSWSDRSTGPDMTSVRAATDMCLMGGWHEHSPRLAEQAGSHADTTSFWVDDARAAIDQAGGRGLILAPGCSVPDNACRKVLADLRRSVDHL
ncbi:MAG: uroporphyrinogen decarboxylase family protein [Sphingobium sp.]